MSTDSQSEQLTQVDADNNVIGPIARGVAHANKSMYYRTIYILIKNARGEVLLQKRSTTKDLYPNCWDISVGGHVMYGDSYEVTAVREIREELGITISENDLKTVGQVLVTLPSSNEHFRVFEYQLKDTDSITIAPDEIESIKWMTMDDIQKSMRDKTLEWYPRPMQIVHALYTSERS